MCSKKITQASSSYIPFYCWQAGDAGLIKPQYPQCWLKITISASSKLSKSTDEHKLRQHMTATCRALISVSRIQFTITHIRTARFTEKLKLWQMLDFRYTIIAEPWDDVKSHSSSLERFQCLLQVKWRLASLNGEKPCANAKNTPRHNYSSLLQSSIDLLKTRIKACTIMVTFRFRLLLHIRIKDPYNPESFDVTD